MEEAVRIIFYVYLGFVGLVFLFYLPRLLYFIAAFLPVKHVANPRKNRLAVVVCAREEGEVVSGVLASLLEQDYDQSFYDIYVVVGGVDDPTGAVARRFPKTEVISVPEQTSKGEALDGGLKAIMKKNRGYEAYVFIDADNLAAKDFLSEMNNALALDKQIVIGKKLIKNFFSSLPESRSYSSDSTALTYTQVDDLGNRARNLLGAPVSTVGTGMMVRHDIIEMNGGWPYRSLTEDYELGIDAMLKDWSTYYYPHARVYTEEATDWRGAYRRRLRWIKGYDQVHVRFRKAIWKKKFPRGKSWIKFGYFLGRFPIYAIFGSSFLFSFVGLVFLLVSCFGLLAYLYPLLLFLVPLAISYLLLSLFNLVTVLADRKNLPIGFLGKAKLVLLSPLYNLTYLPIYLTVAFTSYGRFGWEKTPRIPFKKKDQ